MLLVKAGRRILPVMHIYFIIFFANIQVAFSARVGAWEKSLWTTAGSAAAYAKAVFCHSPAFCFGAKTHAPPDKKKDPEKSDKDCQLFRIFS